MRGRASLQGVHRARTGMRERTTKGEGSRNTGESGQCVPRLGFVIDVTHHDGFRRVRRAGEMFDVRLTSLSNQDPDAIKYAAMGQGNVVARSGPFIR